MLRMGLKMYKNIDTLCLNHPGKKGRATSRINQVTNPSGQNFQGLPLNTTETIGTFCLKGQKHEN